MHHSWKLKSASFAASPWMHLVVPPTPCYALALFVKVKKHASSSQGSAYELAHCTFLMATNSEGAVCGVVALPKTRIAFVALLHALATCVRHVVGCRMQHTSIAVDCARTIPTAAAKSAKIPIKKHASMMWIKSKRIHSRPCSG